MKSNNQNVIINNNPNTITNTKPPKGTLDLYSDDYVKINYYKSQLEKMFIQEGGIGLETPVFELRENLMGKYGEEAESKLVFNLEDNGSEESEKYTLRYDLTIPKMRFVQSKSIDKARIYSIGKVFRRDNPSVGRFREFYQADFDIVGEDSTSLINELILLKLADKFIRINNLGNYKILINDTANLKYLLVNKLQINPNQFKSICSTIDKLDKYSFEEIIEELKTKGLGLEQIELLKDELSKPNPTNPLTETLINKLIQMSIPYGFDKSIRFTPHMARGLDYYNGIIFEIVLDNFKSTIISGGRYDGLIGDSVSLIGISFGLSRMIGLLDKLITQSLWKPIYMITTISNSIGLETKLEIASKLEKKINQSICLNADTKEKKLVKTITYCIQNYIKYLFVIAPDELAQNKIILKDLENSTQELIDLE
jgi:histidyl-tRNA synthetase